MEAEIVFVGRLTTTDDDAVLSPTQQDDVEHVFEQTMDELIELGATDSSVSGSCATGEIRISVLVPPHGKTQIDHMRDVDAMVRSALHAAGVHTPDWNGPDHYRLSMDEWDEMSYQKSELLDA
jgi:hypothetical protein